MKGPIANFNENENGFNQGMELAVDLLNNPYFKIEQAFEKKARNLEKRRVSFY